MYHNFASTDGPYVRTFAKFKMDLERLYKLGFRPVTVKEYIEDKMDLPPGASPVAMTFDDADPSQFILKPDGTVDPNCAVGIWLEFAKIHPDFPLHATFYVLPKLWGVREERQTKIDMLKGWGSEIGCHTWTHPQLNKERDKVVEWELSKSLDFLAQYGVTDCSLAYPYGLKPKNMKLLQGFDYRGKHYAVTAGLLADTNLAKSPVDKKFDKYEIPRIEGNDSLDYWLERFEHGRKAYVSP